jgi:hypothetical protein
MEVASRLTAKYDGTCVKCGYATYAGDTVYWQKGKGVWHTSKQVCQDAQDYWRDVSTQQAEQAFELGSNYGVVNGWYDNPRDYYDDGGWRY